MANFALAPLPEGLRCDSLQPFSALFYSGRASSFVVISNDWLILSMAPVRMSWGGTWGLNLSYNCPLNDWGSDYVIYI